MKTYRCPNCRSEHIVFQAGGHTGMYECKDCGYIGPIILEVEKEEEKNKGKR